MKKEKQLSIVIPAYNEGARIAGVLRAIPKKIVANGVSFRTKVIVIDDCSKDDTYQQAKKHADIVLRHVINSGAGAATRTGFRYCLQDKDVDYVVTIDADGQHATEDIQKMLSRVLETNAGMIVGNRLHKGNKVHMPMHRTFGNWGLTLYSRLLFGIKVQDTQSGLRLVASKHLPHVAEYIIDRYGFCTEMLWLAVRHKVPIEEVPITVSYSEETLAKGQNNWGSISLLLDLLWLRVAR